MSIMAMKQQDIAHKVTVDATKARDIYKGYDDSCILHKSY